MRLGPRDCPPGEPVQAGSRSVYLRRCPRTFRRSGMNILYVCADRGIPLCGNKGASAHVRAITGALQRNGHAVVVVTRNVGGDNQAPDVSATAKLDSDEDAATMQLKD